MYVDNAFLCTARRLVLMAAILVMPMIAAAAEPMVKPEAPPRFTADLSVDAAATTYFFPKKQTAFSLELSPRFGVTMLDFIDFGLNIIAGYGSGVHSWTQATMFGIGPYVGVRFLMTPNWKLMPWAGILYHQTFLDGFTPGPATDTTGDNFTAVRQIVRADLHLDAVYRPQARTSFNVGVFMKTRAASFGSGLGNSPELSAGVRLGAVSYF